MRSEGLQRWYSEFPALGRVYGRPLHGLHTVGSAGGSIEGCQGCVRRRKVEGDRKVSLPDFPVDVGGGAGEGDVSACIAVICFGETFLVPVNWLVV